METKMIKMDDFEVLMFRVKRKVEISYFNEHGGKTTFLIEDDCPRNVRKLVVTQFIDFIDVYLFNKNDELEDSYFFDSNNKIQLIIDGKREILLQPVEEELGEASI